MSTYDGTTSLNTALAKLHGKSKDYGNTPFANITRKYKADLGLAASDKITTKEQRLFIYNKEYELYGESAHIEAVLPPDALTTSHETGQTPSESNSIELREQPHPVRGGKGKSRPRSDNYVTGSHVERNVKYGRVKLNSGALLSLEPVVIKAIKFLDPKMDDTASIKSSEWCDKAVANWKGEELNNAAIIRCSVINELLARV